MIITEMTTNAEDFEYDMKLILFIKKIKKTKYCFVSFIDTQVHRVGK